MTTVAAVVRVCAEPAGQPSGRIAQQARRSEDCRRRNRLYRRSDDAGPARLATDLDGGDSWSLLTRQAAAASGRRADRCEASPAACTFSRHADAPVAAAPRAGMVCHCTSVGGRYEPAGQDSSLCAGLLVPLGESVPEPNL